MALSRSWEGASVGPSFCCWQVLLVFLAARPRPKRPRQHEPDPAHWASRLALQSLPDPVIFLEHLGRDRRPGIAERGLEIGHRDLGGIEPPAERREAGTANQILEIGAGEAIGPLGERFEVDVRG